MDITVCCLNKKTKQLTFSAANNNLYLVKNDSLHLNEKEFFKYKANRQSCGYSDLNKPFSQQTIQLAEGDCIYTFTDGFADQFGGPKGKKFRYKQFEQLLFTNSHLDFSIQKNLLDTINNNWKGELEQLDDILVIGIKV